MLKITFNNIVMPLQSQINGYLLESKADNLKNGETVNYNTYLMLTPLFKSLIVSTTTATSRYNLYKIKSEADLGFYFNYIELNLSIKVPIRAVFNDNDKIKGMSALSFSTAKNCPSRSRGYCQLDDTELCYARQGEKQATKKPFKMLYGMDSLKNGELCIYYWNLFKRDAEVRHTLIRYINFKDFKFIRFNLKGDFKDVSDIKALEYIAINSPARLYGYTARDDLQEPLFNMINNHEVILNGSNMIYNNQFLATDSLYIYLNAPYNCLGECLKCGNCRTRLNTQIIALIHGAGSDTKLKTSYNIDYLCELLNGEGLNITPEDLKNIKLSGLLSSLNRWLEINGYRIFEGQGKARDFRNYLRFIHKRQGGI